MSDMSEQVLMGVPVNAVLGSCRTVLDDFSGMVERRFAGPPPVGIVHDFRVRLAQTSAQHRTASVLVKRMYAWRGYQGTDRGLASGPRHRTLVICEGDAVVGTLSIGGDPCGHILSVEQSFPEEVQALRQAGHRLCEFTKLAVDGDVRSRELLGSLFHAAYRYADNVHAAEIVLVEVNPRHVRFYARLLGFEVRSGVRLNERVNAPAVLLSLDLTYGLSEIARLGGQPHRAPRERSFYPYFLSLEGAARVFVGGWARSRSS